MRTDPKVRLRAALGSLLERVAAVNRDTPKEEILGTIGEWKRFRTTVTQTFNGIEPGAVQKYFAENLFCHDAWKEFRKLRSWFSKKTDKAKTRRRAYAKKHYKTLVAKRTPAELQEINRQRRERYAQKKARASQVPDILGSV